MDSYIHSLCSEISSTLQPLQPHQIRPLKTLFFGGGTPSLLPPHLLAKIIDSLDRACGLVHGAEISMEMDPGTFTAASLKEFMNCGVNRVSLGVQAFNDDLLKACGRTHGVREVCEAVETIHACGVKNWSLDLICSLPHQTLALWEDSLRRAIEAQSVHISVYDLQVEEGTKFGLWYKSGQHPLPSEESSAAFYRLASSMLREAGYEHYEISNYAKPGFECQHNLVYWQNQPYYGFGLGATSYLQGQRFSRPKKWKGYADFVKNLEGSTAEVSSTNQSPEDRLFDTVMLSLRLARGLDLVEISQDFGISFSICICKALLPFVQSGHAVALDANKRPLSPEFFSTLLLSDGTTHSFERDVAFMRLTDPEGFLFSNEIISSVFSLLPSDNSICKRG